MEEPTIRVPVICPSCTTESVSLLRTAYAAAGLISGDCLAHRFRRGAHWNATGERE